MSRNIIWKTVCVVLINILVSPITSVSYESLLNKEVLKNVNDRGGRLIFTYPGDDNKVVFVVYYAEKNDVVDENELKTVEYKINVNTLVLRLEKVQEINKAIGDMFKAKSKTKEILKYFTNKNFSISESYVLKHDPFNPNEEVSPVIKGRDAKKESVRFKLNYSRKDFFPEGPEQNQPKQVPQLEIVDDEEKKEDEEIENVKNIKKTVLEITFSFTPDLKKNSVNFESTDPEDLDFHYRFIKKKNVVKYYKKKAFLFKFLGTNLPENAPNTDNKPLIKLVQGEAVDTEVKEDEDEEDDENDDDDEDEKKSEADKSKTNNNDKGKVKSPENKKAETSKTGTKDKNVITILVIVLVVLAFLVFLLAIVKIYMTSQEHKKMGENNHDKIAANEKQVDI